MCDTFVVVKPDSVLFGKNSDRAPNEAQVLSWVPARDYDQESGLRCTWRTIPQVERTAAMVLSRPFWMWGAEMGANEHGVVIGNEAIFSKAPLQKDGLLGMDLVRLGLERGSTAAAASDVICELIRRYGQGGRCSYDNAGLSYHNSFLVADHKGAWLVEAAGRKVARKEITDGIYAISNDMTLPDLLSRRDRIRPWVADAMSRRRRVQCAVSGVSSPQDAMTVLRDHGTDDGLPRYSRLNGAMSAPCMHAGGWLAASQTTGSLVSELTESRALQWATGTAAPCLSVFRPVTVEQPRDVGRPTGEPDDSLWWRFESVHRAMLIADVARHSEFLGERDDAERRIRDTAEDAWQIADTWLERCALNVPSATTQDPRPSRLRRYWRKTGIQAASGSLLPWRDA